MRLVVGVDTRDRSQGALRFGVWLRTLLGDTDVELLLVHVLAHDEMMLELRRRPLADVLEDARVAVDKAVAQAGAGQLRQDVDIVQAISPEDYLAQAARLYRADGLVIGRSARRHERSVVRLGRVARRLARRLPSPVFVVPPDLRTSHLGDGPVLCAASPSVAAGRAAHAAVELAERLGRRAHLLNVVTTAHAIPDAIAADPLGDLGEAELENARRTMLRWCRAQELGDADMDVVGGDPATVILAHAARLRSPLVVCGSRRLDLVQRIFNSSLGTDLARSSPIPVMIVPPAEVP